MHQKQLVNNMCDDCFKNKPKWSFYENGMLPRLWNFTKCSQSSSCIASQKDWSCGEPLSELWGFQDNVEVLPGSDCKAGSSCLWEEQCSIMRTSLLDPEVQTLKGGCRSDFRPSTQGRQNVLDKASPWPVSQPLSGSRQLFSVDATGFGNSGE